MKHTKRLWPTLAILALLCSGVPAAANDYADDTCPDRGGKALIVDTPAKAATVANGFSLPTCDLIIRTDIDAVSVTGAVLRITARSITLEGPLTVHNAVVDSRVIMIAQDGDIALSNARIVALRDLWLECRAPATCAITIQKGSGLRASRSIRTVARGTVSVEDSRLEGTDVGVEAKSAAR